MIVITLSSCDSIERMDNIKKMFSTFEQKGDFVLSTGKNLYIGNSDGLIIEYRGKTCIILALSENCAYAYCINNEEETIVTVVCIDYTTRITHHLIDIFLPDKLQGSGSFENTLYFKYSNNKSIGYALYSLSENNLAFYNEDDDKYEEVKERINNREDSKRFFVNNNKNLFDILLNGGKLLITEKATGIKKTIDNHILETFIEGKEILKYDSIRRILGFSVAYEKDGKLFLLNCIEAGFAACPCYYFIIEYDFDTDSAKYYAMLFMEEYETIDLLFIPDEAFS